MTIGFSSSFFGRTATALGFLPLVACGFLRGSDSGDSAGGAEDCREVCGDLDGDGTDTGDIPNVLGTWSSTFATELFEETCDIENLHSSSETWIQGKTLAVEGYVPDGLEAYFTQDPEEEFQGIVNERGGIIFTGEHEHTEGHMQVAFGGLVFNDVWRSPPRDVIEGFVYLGLDATGDGSIDCDARGNWTAVKSGD